jgi:hypothetical protein
MAWMATTEEQLGCPRRFEEGEFKAILKHGGYV